MNKLKLPNVTLLGIDCVNVERLQKAMDVSGEDIVFGASKLLTSLPTEDPRLIKIPHIGSTEDFSEFCIKELHNYVDTDYVLLVQYDGFVLSADRWNPEFLNYDYIGAPCSGGLWSVKDPASPDSSLIVGNGGFCLRSKKFLEVSAKLLSEGKITKIHPEDAALCVWYRDLLEKEGIKFAPVDLAMKFSVVENYGAYEKPFGFHGLYDKNMETLAREHPTFPMQVFLPRIRGKRLEKIKDVFAGVAIEGHILGSVARGNADLFSDLDVWLTFKDRDVSEVLEKRLEYYSQVGPIVHLCEAPQNSPEGGVYSFVLYKTKVGLLQVDFCLCPQSTSFKTGESKELFGDIELPIGELGLNPHKVVVSDSYRLDFLIMLAFIAIKKLLRSDNDALGQVIAVYGYLSDRYSIPVEPLLNTENTFSVLEAVIANVGKLADEKQSAALSEILDFAKKVKKQ